MAEVEEPIVDNTVEEESVEEEEVLEEEPDFGSDVKEIKLFGKWDFSSIEVRDISLVVRYTDMIV
jgi:hypothetical protein